ncbi:MAG: hypothetical protein R3E68_13110 [Burkholderiaceae bacterium]
MIASVDPSPTTLRLCKTVATSKKPDVSTVDEGIVLAPIRQASARFANRAARSARAVRGAFDEFTRRSSVNCPAMRNTAADRNHLFGIWLAGLALLLTLLGAAPPATAQIAGLACRRRRGA